jgi:hypothetical protein
MLSSRIMTAEVRPSADIKWTNLAHSAIGWGAAISAFFAPLLHIFPHLNHRYLEWSGPPAEPNDATIIANIFAIVGMLASMAGFGSFLLVGLFVGGKDSKFFRCMLTALAGMGMVPLVASGSRGFRLAGGVSLLIIFVLAIWSRSVSDFVGANFIPLVILCCVVIFVFAILWLAPIQMLPLIQFEYDRWFSPHHFIARRGIVGASKIAAESGQLGQVCRQRF